MGMLGTDYTLRSAHVIFLLLLASSLLLGFNYLSEMYQRIQLQEQMETQTQRLIAERAIIQRKESILQTQIDNRNKEMKRMKELYASQVGEENSICEKERTDLLEAISSKDDTIAAAQTQYEHLKKHFEHLQSLLGQFEKNQSRLLEKFSTQSTQCMNVIHMLSALCHKGKGNVIQKIAQEAKQNETYRAITQLSSSVKTTVSMAPPQDSPKNIMKHTTERSRTRPPTKDAILDSDHYKQSSLKPIRELQEWLPKLNNTSSTQNYENGIVKLEKILNQLNSTQGNVTKSQIEEGGNKDEDKIAVDKDLSKNMLIKETLPRQTQNTVRQTENEKLPVLTKVSESKNPNPVKLEKVNNTQYPTLLSKNKIPQLTDQNSRKEDKTNNTKSELKPYSSGNILKVQEKPQGLTLEKVKAPGQDLYKVKEYEKEDNILKENVKAPAQDINKVKEEHENEDNTLKENVKAPAQDINKVKEEYEDEDNTLKENVKAPAQDINKVKEYEDEDNTLKENGKVPAQDINKLKEYEDEDNTLKENGKVPAQDINKLKEYEDEDNNEYVGDGLEMSDKKIAEMLLNI